MSSTLKTIDDSMMTIVRKRWGNGFRYIDDKGEFIAHKKLLKRIKGLVIPPMWTEVTICRFEDGHIQATGRDAKGRKQYIYHEQWQRERQQEKFKKLVKFGRDLPEIREFCYEQVKQHNWGLNKICALIILVLDETGVRIGNSTYTKRNETYGLSTLRRKHLNLENGHLTFQFIGKKHKEREVTIEDSELIKMIKKSAELPGYEIFRYNDGQSLRPVDSSDVNEFIHTHFSEDYSCKDFRTWVASRYALELYPSALEIKEEFPRRKLTNILLRQVAELLGNTPTVCRDYYVHPKIVEAVENRELDEMHDEDASISEFDLSEAEKMVLEIIQE